MLSDEEVYLMVRNTNGVDRHRTLSRLLYDYCCITREQFRLFFQDIRDYEYKKEYLKKNRK